jgi:hypothetical protein
LALLFGGNLKESGMQKSGFFMCVHHALEKEAYNNYQAIIHIVRGNNV